MSDKVIVFALTEDEAEDVACCVDALDWSGDPVALAVQGQAAIRAALDRDPDELVEQVARILATDQYPEKDLPDIFMRHPGVKERYMDLARAAIAALTGKGKD